MGVEIGQGFIIGGKDQQKTLPAAVGRGLGAGSSGDGRRGIGRRCEIAVRSKAEKP